LSTIWVGDVDLDWNGQCGVHGSRLTAASGDADEVEETVRFKTRRGGDIDLAVGDGLSSKMTDSGHLVTPTQGLTRAVEQFERDGVKGKELGTADDPENPVAVAVGGDGCGVAAGVFPGGDRSAEQSAGQGICHDWRAVGSEVDRIVPIGRGAHHDVYRRALRLNDGDFLQDLTVSCGVQAQAIAIENESLTVLAARNEFMGKGAVLIG